QIVMHVRMWDDDNASQQEALGVVGINLIYGAFFHYNDPERLIESLLDSLSTARIEVDMIEFSGIEFRRVDNRVMALRLVQLGLTEAAMFASDGRVLQPSEVLRKKVVIVERGRFRPVTRINLAMLDAAQSQLAEDSGVAPDDCVTLLEMTMRNLMSDGQIDLRDFLSRAEVVAATGHTVLISNYFEYYRLAAYLARYTDRDVAIVMGVPALPELFNETYYQRLAGGTLEAFGRLFKNDVRIYVYPMKDSAGALVTANDYQPSGQLGLLYQFLLGRGVVVALRHYREDVLHIRSDDVIEMIRLGDPAWEDRVPEAVAAAIRRRGLFGFRPDRGVR
ncbi:MAG: TonB-dependent receptor, partial [Gammaproteobacteria bacterium]